MYKFKENSVVCFYGDSITFAGLWIRRIYDYYRRQLGMKIEMYNCGVPGDNSELGYSRMDETLFINNPTDVVLAFGMNDIHRWIYTDGEDTDEVIKEKEWALENSIKHLELMAKKLKEKNIRIIFATPTIYDEESELDEICYAGSNNALKILSYKISELAKKYGDNIVDFNTEFAMLQNKFSKDGHSLVKTDRTHPNNEGYEVMAQIFLKTQGFDIEYSQKYDELETLANSSYDDWEEKRFLYEQKSKDADYVLWIAFRDLRDEDEILKAIEKALTTKVEFGVRLYYERYKETYMDVKKYRKLMVEHTKSLL